MLKIGLTGGIGSGKTTVSRVFTGLGVPVYQADDQAKALIHNSSDLRRSIIEEFGEKAFIKGRYNNTYMAGIVFNNKKSLEKLNKLIHPIVLQDFEEWLIQHNKNHYVIHEAAILAESGYSDLMDKIVLVDAPLEIRIRRIMERDQLNKKDIEARMRSQWPADKIRLMADWVIQNDENTLILPQILYIHNKLLEIN
jgi:dephospho-CoA kinase